MYAVSVILDTHPNLNLEQALKKQASEKKYSQVPDLTYGDYDNSTEGGQDDSGDHSYEYLYFPRHCVGHRVCHVRYTSDEEMDSYNTMGSDIDRGLP